MPLLWTWTFRPSWIFKFEHILINTECHLQRLEHCMCGGIVLDGATPSVNVWDSVQWTVQWTWQYNNYYPPWTLINIVWKAYRPLILLWELLICLIFQLFVHTASLFHFYWYFPFSFYWRFLTHFAWYIKHMACSIGIIWCTWFYLSIIRNDLLRVHFIQSVIGHFNFWTIIWNLMYLSNQALQKNNLLHWLPNVCLAYRQVGKDENSDFLVTSSVKWPSGEWHILYTNLAKHGEFGEVKPIHHSKILRIQDNVDEQWHYHHVHPLTELLLLKSLNDILTLIDIINECLG